MASVAPSPAEPSLAQQFRAALWSGAAPKLILPPPSTWHPEYPRWRFLWLLQRCPVPTLDHGVLLRQAVRWSGGKLFIGGWTPELAAVGEACGVTLSAAGDLIVAPYRPDWLAEKTWPDGQGLDEPPFLAVPDECLPAEPWLWSLSNGQLRSWHSSAQKEACWQALTAPPGSTTLLGLPTGAGKSLSFQLAARFSAGVTLVVVPTTALAIDQCFAANEILADFRHLGPRYYSANDPVSDPAAVRAALREGACRLLFASPESCVSGSLRGVIDDLAATGRLATLVIDEAHIIDSWGGHFRVEFQLLAIRRNQWLALSGGTLRTLLLSATFTPHCVDLLRTMFGGDQWQQFACQRLRPEISYFVGGFTVLDDREVALIDALHHLPRPLILYVTEVDEAIRLREVLVEAGFAATECFHGDTSGADRRQLLLAWRGHQIEIMVATSAFGMGVDKADVRAVVHACYPENVHRYYQEVGRGGRDGAKSIALWMPVTPKDRKVATSLLPKMLGADLITLRWQTMMAAARDEDGGILNMPTNAKHQRLMGGRSYGENIRWNKRLLLMMARAGLIDLVDLQFEEDGAEPEGRVERVRLRCNVAPGDPRIADLLKAPRERDLSEAGRGITALDAYLTGKAKICRLLRREYGAETIVACSGCIDCRDVPFDRHSIPALDFDPSRPTEPRLDIVSLDIFSTGTKAIGVMADRVADLIGDRRLLHFLCAPDLLGPLTEALAERLVPASRHFYRLDDAREIGRLNVDGSCHVVGLHGRTPDRAMLRLRAGARISHLFPKDAQITDANGRVLLTQEGAFFFPSYDEWLIQV
ncbi:DEAD/DEAH box helicase [Sinorhizobium fredii]|uniref:Helicase-like protein n=1 Tax=Sinorhizobium fredii (strain USDA 257) TaxID=1185652 RepID=I3WZH5_SINF2|nr:DEAD/DEAH box helicase [Sinorhizobium fredii]AFL49031.1 helicase-like protein [Sinorhizobium fredii USDA 257]